jgi:hypothetical protein
MRLIPEEIVAGRLSRRRLIGSQQVYSGRRLASKLRLVGWAAPVQISPMRNISRDTLTMLKITDITGTINQTIPSEVAACVGVWGDMMSSEHSNDDDDAVFPILLLAKS